ncbi:chromo domain-containing protein LHP1 [Prunus yedoensis var. nudiflora]|uniref:Chromo domain-containing protein LHP1 n=1 Tax=Prunus yedoensis var. nudiflora TaxID=2094558 RepID=A0A314UL88_PRUYE|nr:chromo domain-containing protein LHP1 [Prunus yedoensis var. nudiflora]
MKVKGGGRRKSWEAMPLDVVLQDTSNNPNAPFATLLQLQANAAALEQPQEQQQELQEPQALEEADDGEGEGEDDGEVGGDGDREADGVVDDDENRERNKLAEGYYEIEAIRRKRVRKGELQYLIKWRGWPETDNTWEPLDNLHSIADVIEAFEESLRAGKHRKRKRKSGTPHSQPKKRQQRSTDPIYNVTDVEISMQSVGIAFEGENDGHVNNIETTKKVDAENWCSNASQEIGERREENEYDPKLSELRATISTNIVNSDKLSVHFQEAKASEVNGLSKVDCAEPVQSNRNTGAKRRKSGSVKRFKQETQLSELGATPNATSRVSVRYGGRVNQSGAENLDYAGENSSRRNKIDESKSAVRITKIIKPIGYSTSVSNDVQDVSVTFKAMRSDGTEVVVDNKFLKVNHPLLLIDFYEQHLRYNSTL